MCHPRVGGDLSHRMRRKGDSRLRGNDRIVKTEPERSCIVTRQIAPKADLLRFVLSPEGVVVADLASKLPGRGVYVLNRKTHVAAAVEKQIFARAFKKPVRVPADFIANLEQRFRQKLLESLSLARKAGQTVSGFDAVRDALARGNVAALIHASDAGEDGIKKLKTEGIESIQCLTRDELSTVFAKENAVHAAALTGSAGAFFIETARRFALFLE